MARPSRLEVDTEETETEHTVTSTRNIPAHLHTVVERAGSAADAAEMVAVDRVREAQMEVASAPRGRRTGVLILLVLAGLAVVGVAIWRKTAASTSSPDDVTDVRADDAPAGG